jgi:hypothetical protein
MSFEVRDKADWVIVYISDADKKEPDMASVAAGVAMIGAFMVAIMT